MYRDKYGLIVQKDGDGGDTAQRMGMWGFATTLTKQKTTEYYEHMRASFLLIKSPGVFVRHPYQLGFRSDVNEFSRDQQDALLIYFGAAGVINTWLEVDKAFWNQVKRWGKYQNDDWANLLTLGVYIRALNWWALYPLLWLTDLSFIFNALHTYIRGQNPDDSDDNNNIMRMIQSSHTFPTPIGFLGRFLYATIRPFNYGNTKLGEALPIMGALVWYHRASNGGNPEMAELYRPLIKKYFWEG